VSYLLIPFLILVAIALVLGVFVFLGRFRGGRYLKPIILALSKIGFMRRFFQRVSTSAMEKQNPELASALRKMQRAGPNPDPQQAQKAMSQLSAAERRAYLDAVQDQVPEGANRQQRRAQQRLQQGSRPDASGKRPGKRRR
jgi:hypothetical protein